MTGVCLLAAAVLLGVFVGVVVVDHWKQQQEAGQERAAEVQHVR